jgi:hypothetical protein
LHALSTEGAGVVTSWTEEALAVMLSLTWIEWLLLVACLFTTYVFVNSVWAVYSIVSGSDPMVWVKPSLAESKRPAAISLVVLGFVVLMWSAFVFGWGLLITIFSAGAVFFCSGKIGQWQQHERLGIRCPRCRRPVKEMTRHETVRHFTGGGQGYQREVEVTDGFCTRCGTTTVTDYGGALRAAENEIRSL